MDTPATSAVPYHPDPQDRRLWMDGGEEMVLLASLASLASRLIAPFAGNCTRDASKTRLVHRMIVDHSPPRMPLDDQLSCRYGLSLCLCT